MSKHLEIIEGDNRRQVTLPTGSEILTMEAGTTRRNGIVDPWRIAQRALNLLANSRRTIVEQEEQIARLKSLSETDDLTGLLNRRGLMKAASRVLEMARRHEETGAFCYIDLDGFKSTNDNHGHEVGDSVLCHLAAALRSYLRGTDILARLGGDEFVVILVHADGIAADTRARALESLVNSLKLPHLGKFIEIRGTVGVSHYGPNSQVETLLRQADAKMYCKKDRGAD